MITYHAETTTNFCNSPKVVAAKVASAVCLVHVADVSSFYKFLQSHMHY